MFCALFLLFVNVNSIFYPNYLSLLFFIHIFSKSSINDLTSAAIVYNAKLVFVISLIAISLQFLFGLVIDT
jgi:hypothetical protein